MEQTDVQGLLLRVLEVLHKSGALSPVEDSKVIEFHQPQDLEEILSDFSLNESCSESRLLELVEQTAKLSVRTGHPMFFNQLYGGVDKYGLVGALVSEALNTSAYTHEVAPVFSLSEREVIKASLKLVNFKDGDGIFSPGGSISNMYGIVVSRYKKFPNVKQTGLFSLPPLVLFTSQESHYSITKGAHWLGLGTDNVVKVKCDDRGRMIPSELESAIARASSEGKVPLMVNCTAGSTVLGAFDPLEEVAEICQRLGIWMHVDACWGGTLLLSAKHRNRLAGIEKADSVSWNPHKMLGAPLQCSLFLLKHGELLKLCNMAGATYLFQKDKMYDPSYDSGDKSVQCGRKVDSFKLWTLWKARGNLGLGALVDHAIDMSIYFLEKIKGRPGFKPVLAEYETTNICFWYVPPRLRDQPETEEWWEQIHKVGPTMKKKFTEEGVLLLGYQPLEYRELKNFFRMVVTCHPPRSKEQMDRVVELFEKYGSEL
ncbi:hypothetical protein GE061_006616 [Apolygus lucorum]|uniref:Uncharacterized protein n=1 Tax=Apolygus lucorum TaxID=248454 RepID=A0A6A4IML6_APOLU|nr:hypothetical protein GE061_006616 [Apolygus lucorum]